MGKNKLDRIGQAVQMQDCPGFGYPQGYIQAAQDRDNGGQVNSDDISCGGVALQRVDCLLAGCVTSGDYCKRVGGLGILQIFTKEKPCLPKDLNKHFEKWFKQVEKVKAKNRLQAHLASPASPAAVCCGPTCDAHWVTAIGIFDGQVYWIDYDGISRAPVSQFISIASSGQPFINDDTLLVTPPKENTAWEAGPQDGQYPEEETDAGDDNHEDRWCLTCSDERRHPGHRYSSKDCALKYNRHRGQRGRGSKRRQEDSIRAAKRRRRR